MRRRRAREARTLLAVALLAAVTGCATASPQARPLPASTVQVAEGSWEVMPEAPLSPRGAVAAAWTGDRLLLLGGVRTDGVVAECPPAASCTGPPATGLADGAAWDPATRTWVHLRSSLPEAPDSPGLLSRDPGVWSGTQLLTRSSAITADLAAGTVEVGEVDLGPALVYAEPVWTGRELVGVGWDYGGQASGVDGQLVAQVLDPATGQARSVPWPFDPPGAENVHTAWTGREVIAFVAVLAPSGSSTRVVAFDPASGTTTSTALPDGGSGTLLASRGGQLLLTGERSHLRTATTAGAGPGEEAGSGPGQWRRLPELPTEVDTQQRTTAWAGEQIVVWGGRASGIEGGSSANTAEGWTLTPQ